MKTKKCMWCLKEFEGTKDDKFCSEECDKKNTDNTKKKKSEKKSFLGGLMDILSAGS